MGDVKVKAEKYKSAIVEKEKEGKFTIIATTNDKDRDGEVVEPSGVNNMTEYMTNPQILFGHNPGNYTVGRAVDYRLDSKKLELDIEFAPTEAGKELEMLYKKGFMNAFSIGFIPIDMEEVDGTIHWTDWRLLEVSAVTIPANPYATMVRDTSSMVKEIKSKGIDIPALENLYQKSTGGAEQRKPVYESTKTDKGYWVSYIKFTRRK